MELGKKLAKLSFLFLLVPFLVAFEPPESVRSMHLSAKSYIASGGYVHSWIPFPTLNGTDLAGKKLTIEPATAKINVYVVTASWCIKCQNLMDYLKTLSKNILPVNAKFIYVFAHDTAKDAKGFVDTYKIGEQTIMASSEILKELHNPQLPSIQLADRNAWLLTRFDNATRQDLKELETLLQYMGSY